MAETSPFSFDELLQKIDIVDVVSAYVSLTPSGKNYKGLCPFHAEKTPSFHVSKERQLFNCFGCGTKGNAFTFVSKIRNISYLDAVKTLADEYHLEVNIKPSNTKSSGLNRYYEIVELAQRFYQLSLTNLQSGQNAMQYLTNRGLDLATIEAFQIGYAPNQMDALYQVLKEKASEVDLLELGLIKKNQDGQYHDLFHHRILFPITNETGRTVGFSGRIFESDSVEPKYVNSPFTKLFLKGELLYHLHAAIPHIQRQKRVFLMEGFLDVIAAHRAGVFECVASMGTALTSAQARLLHKYTDHVIVSYDGDKAGFEAMNKAIQILESERLQVSLLVFPEAFDPDEYIAKYGKEKLAYFFEKGQVDPWEFRYLYIKRQHDLSFPSGKERFKDQLFLLLLQSGSETLVQWMLQRMATDLNVTLDAVQSDYRHLQLAQKLNQSNPTKKPEFAKRAIQNNIERAEEMLICYYLEGNGFRDIIRRNLRPQFCSDPINMEILETIYDLESRSKEPLNQTNVLKRFAGARRETEISKRLHHTLIQKSTQELEDLIYTIFRGENEKRIKEISEEILQLDPASPKRVELVKELNEAKRKDISWKNRKL